MKPSQFRTSRIAAVSLALVENLEMGPRFADIAEAAFGSGISARQTRELLLNYAANTGFEHSDNVAAALRGTILDD